MKPEQAVRLEALQEKLVELFLREADPDKLPGAGLDIGAMDRQTRGDAYWSKRNAAASIMLASRITSFMYQQADLARRRAMIPTDPDGDDETQQPIEPSEPVDDLDKDISKYEREAAKLIKAAQKVGQQ